MASPRPRAARWATGSRPTAQGRIRKYELIVPTTWNMSPRDAQRPARCGRADAPRDPHRAMPTTRWSWPAWSGPRTPVWPAPCTRGRRRDARADRPSCRRCGASTQALVAAGAQRPSSASTTCSRPTRPRRTGCGSVWLHGELLLRLLGELPQHRVGAGGRHPDAVREPGVPSGHLAGHRLPGAGPAQRLARLPACPISSSWRAASPSGCPTPAMMADRPIGEWAEELARGAVACVGGGDLCRGRRRAQDEGHGVPAAGPSGSPARAGHLDAGGQPAGLPHEARAPRVHGAARRATARACPRWTSAAARPGFFAHTVHERCIHYSDFQEERFAQHIGEDGCLLRLGCRVP